VVLDHAGDHNWADSPDWGGGHAVSGVALELFADVRVDG
jgi:hypothetical protein